MTTRKARSSAYDFGPTRGFSGVAAGVERVGGADCFDPLAVLAATAAFGFWVFALRFAVVFGFVVARCGVEDDDEDDDDEVEPPVNGRLCVELWVGVELRTGAAGAWWVCVFGVVFGAASGVGSDGAGVDVSAGGVVGTVVVSAEGAAAAPFDQALAARTPAQSRSAQAAPTFTYPAPRNGGCGLRSIRFPPQMEPRISIPSDLWWYRIFEPFASADRGISLASGW